MKSKSILSDIIVLTIASLSLSISSPNAIVLAQSSTPAVDSLRKPPPEFPHVVDTTAETKLYEIRTYPSLSVNVGPAFGDCDAAKLNESFVKMEEAYGVDALNNFSGGHVNFAVGLRAHFSKRVALWWEFLAGGGADEGASKVSVVSFSLMMSPVATNEFTLSLGAGYAQTYVQAKRGYGSGIPNSSGILNSIKLDRASAGGLPLSLLVEICSPALQRHRLYLSVKYIIANDFYDRVELWETPYINENKLPISVGMRSLWFSVGLAIGS